MGYLGYKPADKPLTSADITDGIITSAKITDATIVNGDIANSTISLAKLSATGTPSAATFLRGDNAWGEAGAAAGQVIQVVTATDSTERSTTSTSYVTGSNTLSVSITPSSTSNKILILLNTCGAGTATGDERPIYTIYRGATDLASSSAGFTRITSGSWGTVGISLLDSPSTTSSTTYQVYMKVSNSAITGYLNYLGSKGSITVLEIKG